MEARKQERNVGTLYPALLLTPNTYQPTQSVFRPVVEWNISVVFIIPCPIVWAYAGYTLIPSLSSLIIIISEQGRTVDHALAEVPLFWWVSWDPGEEVRTGDWSGVERPAWPDTSEISQWLVQLDLNTLIMKTFLATLSLLGESAHSSLAIY